MKVVNIHTDPKFLGGSRIFDDFANSNITILLTDNKKLETDNSVLIYNFKRNDFKKVVTCCNSSDVVVLWGLCSDKRAFIEEINDSVKIIWRFFGSEIYNSTKNKKLFLEPLSAKYSNETNKITIRKIYNRLKRIVNKQTQVKSKQICYYYKKIDRFMCLHKIEYDLLTKLVPDLPKFMQVPYSKQKTVNNKANNKIVNQLVIGANRQQTNNHIDLLVRLFESENIDKYKFDILFNYGAVNNYTDKVKKLVLGKNNFTLIEDFIPKEVYGPWLDKNMGLVVNSLRQNSMGSIFMALRSGIKVFLNKNGIMYQFLRDSGFIIHAIDDLIDIIKNSQNIEYDELEAKVNFNSYNKLSETHSIEKFYQDINSLLQES